MFLQNPEGLEHPIPEGLVFPVFLLFLVFLQNPEDLEHPIPEGLVFLQNPEDLEHPIPEGLVFLQNPVFLEILEGPEVLETLTLLLFEYSLFLLGRYTYSKLLQEGNWLTMYFESLILETFV